MPVQTSSGQLVACGQIAGIREEGKLVVALAEVGDSAASGIAILEEADDRVELTVYIIVPSDEDVATPAA